MSSGQYELKDFHTEVVEASRTVPVVVDFWATWCGPCRTLSPILEKLAGEAAGAWKLVTVDVDRNQELAGQFQVRSIPSVKLVRDARIVDEFTGAMPEGQVRAWLARHVGEAPAPAGGTLTDAEQALAAGDVERARTVLEALAEKEPGPEVNALLAAAVVWDDPARAAHLAGIVQPDARHHDVARAAATMARLLTLDVAALAADPARGPYTAGIAALRDRDFDRAAGQFIEAVQVNRAYDDDGPRLACIALFNLLGRSHPVTQEWRRRFNMALH
jgi:putative thioredoxin